MPSEQDKGVNDAGQARNNSQREALSNAYAALTGQQSIQTWTAFTFEEAMDAQIERIEGKSSDKRPNELERVERIEKDTLSAIAALRDTAPEQFIEANSDQDVNTPREGED
jgi:TPP-dependent indolepyruvate ferredoxin oxidoreductase alpha subunit